jgi:hypothetical protein
MRRQGADERFRKLRRLIPHYTETFAGSRGIAQITKRSRGANPHFTDFRSAIRLLTGAARAALQP